MTFSFSFAFYSGPARNMTADFHKTEAAVQRQSWVHVDHSKLKLLLLVLSSLKRSKNILKIDDFFIEHNLLEGGAEAPGC